MNYIDLLNSPPLPHKFKSRINEISYEWEMKNFSSYFPLLHSPYHPNTALSIPDSTRQGQERQPHLSPSIDHQEEENPRCEWDFHLSTVISATSAAGEMASDAIGAIEFDRTGTLLATGGIARKIRIYDVQKAVGPRENPNDGVLFLGHGSACEYYLCTPAKLSGLKWKPGSDSRVIGSADYDGVVMEYDLEKRVPFFERDEHGGKRVWSIDYSSSDPVIGASGSDDGTMQMWDPRCDGGKCLASVQPNRVGPSPICSVEFNPFGGHLLVVGCADRRIYGYDMRRAVDPVFILDGHQKAVTYTRFLDLQTIVSSSIDGSLMMWSTEDHRPIRTYRGHVNGRRFVGLSVWRNDGLLCCGSEDNQVFVYDKRWGQPIWVTGFGNPAQPANDRDFISGVCWRETGEGRGMLVAGGSDGVLRVFEGQRKSCP